MIKKNCMILYSQHKSDKHEYVEQDCVLLDILWILDVCLSVLHRCICVEKKNQLDATGWFIALIICSACFGHFYVHHQELETICVLLPSMVCSAWVLVVGGQVLGSRLCVQEEAAITHTHIVSSS